ncbi:hypothetical protein HMPREF9248_0750 [Fannyhessea vaginae PB189-T1-4]|uniref:Uncharacterized protein n=1 Tax=Fannyhessea vaginae PB189-T1-4 TaxID=866774 RepID=A0ABN0B1M3_9ACTN|nr:hypothetical protein HMPREF9248_0750 [Fannyhessea vaginae PB189-T1-4]
MVQKEVLAYACTNTPRYAHNAHARKETKAPATVRSTNA